MIKKKLCIELQSFFLPNKRTVADKQTADDEKKQSFEKVNKQLIRWK